LAATGLNLDNGYIRNGSAPNTLPLKVRPSLRHFYRIRAINHVGIGENATIGIIIKPDQFHVQSACPVA